MRPIWALFPQEVHEVSYVEAVSEPDRFAEYVDQVLGTAVGIFDYSYSDHETAGLLAVSDLRYENIDQHGWHTENYDPYTAILTIDHPLLGSFTDSRREAIQNVLKLIHEGELATKVNELLENSKEKIVLIKGVEEVEYSAIMAAMDQLRQAGIEDIGLITERKKVPGSAAGGQ